MRRSNNFSRSCFAPADSEAETAAVAESMAPTCRLCLVAWTISACHGLPGFSEARILARFCSMRASRFPDSTVNASSLSLMFASRIESIWFLYRSRRSIRLLISLSFQTLRRAWRKLSHRGALLFVTTLRLSTVSMSWTHSSRTPSHRATMSFSDCDLPFCPPSCMAMRRLWDWRVRTTASSSSFSTRFPLADWYS